MNTDSSTPRPAPSLKPGWKMPTPPAEGCKPHAHFVGQNDGFDLFWATEEQAVEGSFYDDGTGDHPRVPRLRHSKAPDLPWLSLNN